MYLSFQILENVKFKNEQILKSSSLIKSIKIAKKLMMNKGRDLVRKSNRTNNKGYGGSEDKKLMKKCIQIIKKKLDK